MSLVLEFRVWCACVVSLGDPFRDGETIISARSGVSVQPRSIIVGSSRTTKLSLTPYLA